jgi:hypothetical protein
MHVVRLRRATWTVFCLCLVGMPPVAGGCGPDYTTAPTTTPEQKDKMDKFTDTMKGARGPAMKDGRKNVRGGSAEKTP